MCGFKGWQGRQRVPNTKTRRKRREIDFEPLGAIDLRRKVTVRERWVFAKRKAPTIATNLGLERSESVRYPTGDPDLFRSAVGIKL